MSDTVSNTRSALVKAFVDANVIPAVDTAYENTKFVAPGRIWARVTFNPNQPEIATLGQDGQDKFNGFLQIDLNVPLDTGEKAINDKFEAIRNLFAVGTRPAYDGQEAIIISCGRSGGRIVDNYYRVSVSIYFYAYLQR